MIWIRLSGLAIPFLDPLSPLVVVVWGTPIALNFVWASMHLHDFIQD